MKIALMGDVMLGRMVNEFLEGMPPAYPWGDAAPILKQADLRICNLECVLADQGKPWSSKTFYFRSDSKNAAVFKEGEIDLVSLANNHSLDFGYYALENMLDNLDRAGVGHAGAGMDSDKAMKPVFKEAGGLKIGFISFTDNEPTWEAGKGLPGTFYVPIDLQDRRAAQLIELIKEAKSDSDIVIVSAHWGPNWGYHPEPKHIPFAHALIDAGADIIFGHSAHVFQGIEIYKGKPIFYSAGDFVDDYVIDEIERNDESFVFTVEIEAREIKKIKLYPVVIRDFQAVIASPVEAEEITKKMQVLCEEFKVATYWDSAQGYIEIFVQS